MDHDADRDYRDYYDPYFIDAEYDDTAGILAPSVADPFPRPTPPPATIPYDELLSVLTSSPLITSFLASTPDIPGLQDIITDMTINNMIKQEIEPTVLIPKEGTIPPLESITKVTEVAKDPNEIYGERLEVTFPGAVNISVSRYLEFINDLTKMFTGDHFKIFNRSIRTIQITPEYNMAFTDQHYTKQLHIAIDPHGSYINDWNVDTLVNKISRVFKYPIDKIVCIKGIISTNIYFLTPKKFQCRIDVINSNVIDIPTYSQYTHNERHYKILEYILPMFISNLGFSIKGLEYITNKGTRLPITRYMAESLIFFKLSYTAYKGDALLTGKSDENFIHGIIQSPVFNIHKFLAATNNLPEGLDPIIYELRLQCEDEETQIEYGAKLSNYVSNYVNTNIKDVYPNAYDSIVKQIDLEETEDVIKQKLSRACKYASIVDDGNIWSDPYYKTVMSNPELTKFVLSASIDRLSNNMLDYVNSTAQKAA